MSTFHEKRKRRLSSGWGLKLGQHQSPSRRRKSVAPLIMEQAGLDENDDQAERDRLREEKKAKERRRKTLASEELKRPARKVFAELSNVPVAASQDVVSKEERLDDSQLSLLYSECIKLATANKINQKNTWELDLISHMDRVLDSHIDLTGDDETKEDPGQERDQPAQMNFQKASCTLDASVKIYSYRVDSVHKDTFKVLGGLTRSDNRKNDDSAEEADDEKARKRKERRRPTATLEANPDQLSVKTLDLEFDVDPLFRKTSASFDEGGARGMLLANLSVHGGHHLVFDSTSSVGATSGADADSKETADTKDADTKDADTKNSDADTQDSDTDTKDNTAAVVEATAEPDIQVDISKLTSMLSRVGPLQRLKICPLLAEMREYTESILGGDGEPATSAAATQDDYEVDVPEVDYGFDDSDDDGGFAPGPGIDLEEAIQREEMMFKELQSLPDDGEDAESKSSHAEFQAAMPSKPTTIAIAAEAGEFSYLDQARFQNWAGPAHWKFPKRAAVVASGQEDEHAEAPKKRRTKKAAFAVDFLAVAEGKRVPEATFKPPPRSNSTLSEATISKQVATSDAEDKNLLPQDIHFKPKRLQTLFHRPNLVVRLRRRASGGDAPVPSHVDHSTSLVCTSAPDAPWCSEDNYDVEVPDVDYDDDDDDDGGRPRLDLYEHVADTVEGGGLALVDQPKMVEKIDIRYAKFAKKVDVRALKQNMWDILETESKAVELPDEKKTGATETGPSFQNVVSQIGEAATKTPALNNVSVPFCFICLLHLANEKELELEPSGDPQALADFKISSSQ